MNDRQKLSIKKHGGRKRGRIMQKENTGQFFKWFVNIQKEREEKLIVVVKHHKPRRKNAVLQKKKK
jgi:hypothetical protein